VGRWGSAGSKAAGEPRFPPAETARAARACRRGVWLGPSARREERGALHCGGSCGGRGEEEEGSDRAETSSVWLRRTARSGPGLLRRARYREEHGGSLSSVAGARWGTVWVPAAGPAARMRGRCLTGTVGAAAALPEHQCVFRCFFLLLIKKALVLGELSILSGAGAPQLHSWDGFVS